MRDFFISDMKLYIFLFFICVVVVAGAYWAGGRVAAQKCNARAAEVAVKQNQEIIKTMGAINEKTFNTGVCDIRRVLREKYTIAE